MSSRGRQADMIALGLTCAVGLPLVYMVAGAYAEGEVRRQETPVRALLGAEAYNALSNGEASAQNYMGDDRLAPDFSLEAADGTTWRLQDQRGKVVVMNFWTTTCQPCVEEMPSLVSLARMIEGRDDIELVTVSVDRDWDTARTVVPQSSPLNVLLDSDREVVANQFGTRLFPETWIIDPDGVIRLRIDGRRNWNDAIVLDVIESYL
ncbi:MAG: peroxiredoxin family protein [Sandaracinaceae bacterium]